MNTHHNFLQFNGKNIIYLNNNGTYYIAVRPICEALNLAYTAQLRALKKDPILGPAYTVQTMQVPFSTEKNKPAFQGRKMASLPEKYIYGWIFSIRSESKELIEYKKTCYEALLNYFRGTITNRKVLLVEKNTLETEIHHIKEVLKEQNVTFQKLEDLEKKKKAINKELTTIDKEIVKQPGFWG